jgi:hypothetical protein
MKTFKNNIGCVALFDDSLPDEEIKKRLSWMGGNWKEVKLKKVI